MNYAIVLSGGTGVRLGGDIPKQYIEVAGMPVIMYCMRELQKSRSIDGICIVAAQEWHEYLCMWLEKEGIVKFMGFAPAGASRQQSIMNGLTFLKNKDVQAGDAVLIHDAARPNLKVALIDRCMEACKSADGVLPVIPVKDTMYLSEDGRTISSLLNRDQLFAGQAPEAFNFGRYYEINSSLSDEELSMIRGSSEIAYKMGLKVALVEGDENNYKITTAVDLDKFTDQCMANQQNS